MADDPNVTKPDPKRAAMLTMGQGDKLQSKPTPKVVEPKKEEANDEEA